MLAHSVRIANLVKKAVNPTEATIDIKFNKPKEKAKEISPEELLKMEIRQSVGKVDPLIKSGVEDVLTSAKYRRKTKFEAMDNVVDSLDKKVRALQEKAFEATENKRKIPEKNPLLDLDPETVDEDKLEEGEILKAYHKKDMDKVELILLKSKLRLEEYDRKFQEKKPKLELPGFEDLALSALTVKTTTSVVLRPHDKIRNKSSAFNSNVVSPYLSASTSASQSFSPAKSLF